MTEIESLMYRILSKMSKSDAPLVFKGALITKLILTGCGYDALERHTRDIDANWIGTPPSMAELAAVINQALGDMQEEFDAIPIREYGEKMSAGISIREKRTGKEAFAMDIDMRPIADSTIYHFGDAEIKGILVNEILADKITVLSKRIMFRRAKDLVDVYALAHCVRIKTSEIFEIFKLNPSREVGTFDEFLSRRNDVEHAYERLIGIEGKPPFDDVYDYLVKFLNPFIQRDDAVKVWNSHSLSWESEQQIIKDADIRPSILDQIHSARKARRDQLSSAPVKSKHTDEPEL